MKRIATIMLIITLLFCSACSRGAGKSVIFAIDASPATLDPQYASEIGALTVINNTFEGLVRYNNKGEIIPGIASKWEISEDGLVYNFTLKNATEWYCPTALKKEFGEDFYNKFYSETITAKDFVFACKRVLDPTISSPHAPKLMVIEGAAQVRSGEADFSALGVKAISDTQLEFRLTHPCEDFLERLTESAFMPCNEEFFNAMGGRYGLSSRHILCNGPFYLSNWNPESSLTIKRNKCYAGEQEVLPMNVVFSFDSAPESIGSKLSNGSLSAAFLPAQREIPEEVNIKAEIPNTVYGFMFNCSDSVIKNANIRKALCETIEISLFDTEEKGVKRTNGFIPESCLIGNIPYRIRVGEQTPSIVYNKSKAKTHFQNGLKNLETEQITVTVLCPEKMDLAVRKQLQLWQKVFGISFAVSVTNMSDKEISTAVSLGNYQIALSCVSSDKTNADAFIADFREGGPFRFNSKTFKGTVDQLKTVESDEEILTGCYTAEDYILEQGVFFPLYTLTTKFVVSNDTEGIYIINSSRIVSFINARRFD